MRKIIKGILFFILGTNTAVAQDTVSIVKNNIEDLAATYYLKGDSCEVNFDFFNALKWYEKAMEINPSPKSIRKVSETLYKRGQFQTSLLIAQNIPNDSLNHSDLRLKYRTFDNLSLKDSLRKTGQLIIERYPLDSDIVSSLASHYNNSELPDSALIYTSSYRDIDSTNIFVNRQFSFSLYLNEDFERAISEYKKLINMGDNSSSSFYYLASSYAKCDSTYQAYDNFLLAAERQNKDNPNILAQLGIMGVKLGLMDESIAYIKRAMELYEVNPELLFTLNSYIAEGFVAKKEYKEGLKHLNECAKLEPSSIITIYKTAQVYGYMKDSKKEKDYYENFLNKVSDIDSPNKTLQKWINYANNRVKEIKEEDFFNRS